MGLRVTGGPGQGGVTREGSRCLHGSRAVELPVPALAGDGGRAGYIWICTLMEPADF